jgi:hypothetical protein
MSDNVQKIKQEIERRRKSLPKETEHEGLKAVYGGIAYELTEILQFIDSLPEEHASEDLDFQTFAEEMHTVFALPSSETKNTEEDPLNWEYAIARHFAEWQKQKDEKLFKDDSWNYIEENYPNISQEEKLRLYDISIKSRLAGANAIKQKMMKDAVDATILDIDAQTIEFGLWPEKLLDIKEGDKVKIIVIKEN